MSAYTILTLTTKTKDMEDQARTRLAEPHQCHTCEKIFSARSSYIRHSKHCLDRTAANSRRKSCRQCSISKTRCDQRHPFCSRCIARKEFCEYVKRNPRSPSIISDPEMLLAKTTILTNIDPNLYWDGRTSTGDYTMIMEDGGPPRPHFYAPLTPNSTSNTSPRNGHCPDLVDQSAQSAETHPAAFTPQPAELTAEPSTNEPEVAPIRDRWLYPYLDEAPARYAIMGHSMMFICRVIRTYPRMMSHREQLPPFIHPSQCSGTIPLPLANCFTLSRMWEGRTDGDGKLVEDTILREINRLNLEYKTYDKRTLVAAFQALLIYSIMLLFPTPQKSFSWTFDLPKLASLQEVGYYVSQTDLVLASEKSHSRPAWDDWVLVGAKRRTLMAVYAFEWIYAMLNGLPTYPCTELGFMPAPAGKLLWSARMKDEWEAAYDRWLGRWTGGGIYLLKELMAVKPGPEIDLRTEMWLEEADEFGIMYMALVNGTEGGITEVDRKSSQKNVNPAG